MTQNGVSITISGEIKQRSFFKKQPYLHIQFRRKTNNQSNEIVEIINNHEGHGCTAKQVANMLFFTSNNDDNLNTDNPNLKGYQHNIMLSTDENTHQLWQNNDHQEVLCIRLSSDFFENYIPPKKVFQHLKKNISSNISGMLSNRHLPLTPNMASAISDILTCTRQGVYRVIYLQAKVIELFLLQLEIYEHQIIASAKETHLPSVHVNKMKLARDILLDNLNTNISLKELANQVGTNEFDLKKNFKKVFGNTVFGYLHQYKMERSKQLLLNTNNKIATIAELMGYKYATHFTAAFKKYFGYLPNKLKIMLFIPWYELESYFIVCKLI